ncbi:hypothetical protein [Neorhodopirellula lusitana]|uniref:hypothetical protein n=1 Tax=Neorhodopirellula lusitana TaxID=445327 RepID=UPI003850D2CA
MSSISSVQSSNTYTQSTGRSQGGTPAERLDQSLTGFLEGEGVSSEDQTKIKSEFEDAVSSLAAAGSQTSPTEIKSALSEVLTSNGLDGESFVSKLGTPGSGQAGRGGGPRGAGGPPPPPKSSSETSETSETTDIETLLELLETQAESEVSSTSSAFSASSESKQTFPGLYINRDGGNLDAQA